VGSESRILGDDKNVAKTWRKSLVYHRQENSQQNYTCHSMEHRERGSLTQGLPKETSGKKVERTTRLLSLPLRKMKGERRIGEDCSTFKQN
jgi:hypothetical protein